jgi:hypothetical protein
MKLFIAQFLCDSVSPPGLGGESNTRNVPPQRHEDLAEPRSLVVAQFGSGKGVPPMNHAQDARATTQTTPLPGVCIS